jgi:hypothetical protein
MAAKAVVLEQKATLDRMIPPLRGAHEFVQAGDDITATGTKKRIVLKQFRAHGTSLRRP